MAKNLIEFENPSFQNDYDDDTDGDSQDGSDKKSNEVEYNDLLEFDEFDEFDDAIEEDEVKHGTNFGKINMDEGIVKWRRGPAPIEDGTALANIKIASLESMHKENNSESDRNAANKALINYFSYLGTSGPNVKVEFNYLENLLKHADINTRDLHGQSIFHEVAREWHTDLAFYVKSHGLDVNVSDNFGRTPLFVAAASGNVLMLKWLLHNEADINHRTLRGEEQTAIHYAAKFDSLECFQLLIDHGANPLVRDAQYRTPFFLAAERGLNRMCAYMLRLELPTCSYDVSGVGVIDHVIRNLSTSSALQALNQYIVVDKTYRITKSYINCLGKHRMFLLNVVLNNRTNGVIRNIEIPGALDIIVERQDLELITHPIILELLSLKRKTFGLRYNILNILFYAMFTLLWTIILMCKEESRSNIKAIIVMTVFVQILTFLFTYKLFLEFKGQRRYFHQIRRNRLEYITSDRKFCHPRWVMEQVLLDKNEHTAYMMTANFWSVWNIVEALCLLMSTTETFLTAFWAVEDELNLYFYYYSGIFVTMLWLRLNKSLRLIQSLGPFIAMFGACVVATARFAFLFFEFFIPFSAAFWVLFSGPRKGITIGEYKTFNDMLYQLFLLTIVGDYDYDTLREVDKVFSQILVGLYFVLVSVISLNLYIALLSEAVARVNQTAAATAFLKEAEEIVNIERIFPYLKSDFERYADKFYAPRINRLTRKSGHVEFNAREMISDLKRSIHDMQEEMSEAIEEMSDIKKNMEDMEEPVKQFKQQHTEKSIDEIFHSLDEVSKFQTSQVNKLHRTTRKKIVSFISRNSGWEP